MNFSPSFNERIIHPDLPRVSLYIKREDVIHPLVSGNKYRKLIQNINYALSHDYHHILTFGGAHSSHIAATAAFSHEVSLSSTAIIRGEEYQHKMAEIPTLQKAREKGMEFIFVSRADYRRREEQDYVTYWLSRMKDKTYYIPEGGSNLLGIKGCEDILTAEDKDFDIIGCSVGTGGTMAGLLRSCSSHQKVIGFSALRSAPSLEKIKPYASDKNWQLIYDDTFGGYARTDDRLINFINEFYQNTNILLDPIYTGKMLYNVFNLYKKNYFCPKTKILLIHTGGLQGIEGMNIRLKNKNRQTINILL